eukprot:92118_1
MPLRLGAYLGTDSQHILDWNRLSKLKSTDLFGGLFSHFKLIPTMPLRLGAYLGTDSQHILDWNRLSKLKSTDLFGGGWVISKYTKQPTPNKKKTHINSHSKRQIQN